MVILESRQLVIITPPHTASGNLHRALCSPDWKGREVWGPNPGVGIDHHYANIHEGLKHYRVVLVWRNPYDRLVGLYEHLRWWATKHARRHPAWEDFVDIVANDRPRVSWMYRTTIAQLVQDTWRLDLLVDFDNLEAGLEKLLESGVKLPPPNTEHPDPATYYTPALRTVLEPWAQQDFDLKAKLPSV